MENYFLYNNIIMIYNNIIYNFINNYFNNKFNK